MNSPICWSSSTPTDQSTETSRTVVARESLRASRSQQSTREAPDSSIESFRSKLRSAHPKNESNENVVARASSVASRRSSHSAQSPIIPDIHSSAHHAARIDAAHRDPHRFELYRIADPDDPIWLEFQRPIPADRRCVRILSSRGTPGIAISSIDDFGYPRIINWHMLPDLLYLDVARFFATHPDVNAIYLEDKDESTYAASTTTSDDLDVSSFYGSEIRSERTRSVASASTVGDATSVSSDSAVAARLLLVLRRCELSHAVATWLRDYQASFFTYHRLGLPDADRFRSTLHGR